VNLLRTGELFSIGCAVLWSAATILFRKSGEHVPPVALNVFKNTVALVLFLVSLAVRGGPFVPDDVAGRDWVVLLISGAVGIGIADSLFLASLNRLGAAGYAIVSSFYAPLVLLCSFAYLDEPLGMGLLLATALMVGAILLGMWEPAVSRSAADHRRVVSGVAIGVTSMLLMAVAIVFAKPVLDRTDPWWATTVRLLGGLLLLAAQGVRATHRRALSACFRPGRAWRVTIPAAVTGSYFAMIVWIIGMKYAFASTAAVLNQTSTLFTVAFGWLFLREAVTLRKVLAVVMAFAGAAVVVL
jgi:drug/metabolite transporter (DMT)-like permease